MDKLTRFENIIIQLGISALVILVVGYVAFKLASKLIDKWSEGDKERTKEIADGFKAITESHARVLETVTNNHTHVIQILNDHQASELEVIAQFRIELNRMDQKVSTALDLTPVHGVPNSDPPAREIKAPEYQAPPPKPPRPQSSPGLHFEKPRTKSGG